MVGKVEIEGDTKLAEIRDTGCGLGTLDYTAADGEGDGGEDADNGDDDNEFDERKG